MKVAQQKTELDRIVARLRTMLRRDSVNAIEKGKLLLRSRELLASEHGEWMTWLTDNFDMSYRSAMNYCRAAEYAKVKGELATVANLAPTVLYQLADVRYTEQVEAEILARAKAGKRVDQALVSAIREELKPPPPELPLDDDDDDDEPDGDDEVEAILDGPPPAVPPPAPPVLPDFALRDFDQAIDTLKRLMTKPSLQFASTVHSANDLEGIEAFIRTVVALLAKQSSDQNAVSPSPSSFNFRSR